MLASMLNFVWLQGVDAGQTSVKYILFAVVEHSGRLNNGHYTAYVRQRAANPKIIKMLQVCR